MQDPEPKLPPRDPDPDPLDPVPGPNPDEPGPDVRSYWSGGVASGGREVSWPFPALAGAAWGRL